MPLMVKLNEIIEWASPVLISPRKMSLTISLSRRFFVFELMRRAVKAIEDDPYLNFISLLKNYKVLGKFLSGTIGEFHRDRDDSYFRNFFIDKGLYGLVKQDIEWLAPQHGHLRVTITKRGLLIYDNYKKNQFNVLLITSHSGTWVPAYAEKKLAMDKAQRYREEDIDSHRLYSRLVLDKAGIWIDNKKSRFACDVNRTHDKSIYRDGQEKWAAQIWKQQLTEKEQDEIRKSHNEFYFTLAQLTDTYRFNIIFDGHTMSDAPERPALSFGTNYIPKFYMPIVKSMKAHLAKLGYSPVAFDTPYYGGHILEWLQKRAPDLFICSMEINKKLYMSPDRSSVIAEKRDKVAQDLAKMFDIQPDDAA